MMFDNPFESPFAASYGLTEPPYDVPFRVGSRVISGGSTEEWDLYKDQQEAQRILAEEAAAAQAIADEKAREKAEWLALWGSFF